MGHFVIRLQWKTDRGDSGENGARRFKHQIHANISGLKLRGIIRDVTFTLKSLPLSLEKRPSMHRCRRFVLRLSLRMECHGGEH